MYHTEGIILKKVNVGESDALIVLYTKDSGIMRALAKGIKKENAKLKGHLEPLNWCSLGVVEGKNGERLTHATALRQWPSIREDQQKLATALYIGDLVARYFQPGEKDASFWSILSGSFTVLEKSIFTPQTMRLFLTEFEKKLLENAGFSGGNISTLGLSIERPF